MDVPEHHVKQSVCSTRAPYREGRQPKAVKVYTINNESRFVLIQGVPSVGAGTELQKVCASFGVVTEFQALDEYPCEDKFTEVYLVKFQRIQSARFAKRKLDEHSFYGGCLHVCYAPEYESVQETREKLQDRRRAVARRIQQHAKETSNKPTSNQSGSEVTGGDDGDTPSLETHSQVQGHQQSPRPSPSSSSLPDKPLTDTHAPALPWTNTSRPTYDAVPQHFNNNNQQQHINNQPYTDTTRLLHNNYWDSGSPNYHNNHHQQQHTFLLPPPPPPSASNMPPPMRPNKYEFSRTRSTHSTLPHGYDGRLHTPFNTQHLDNTPQQSQSHQSKPFQESIESHQIQAKTTQNTNASSTEVQKSAVRSAAHTPLIIKEYKHKGPPPKFVPRQAVKTTQKEGERSAGVKVGEDDDLRKNSFKLGEVQGPAEPPGRKRVLSTPEQKSVDKTISTIRSKISKMIKDSVNNNQ